MRAFARQMTERMKAVAAAGAVAAFWLAAWMLVAALVLSIRLSRQLSNVFLAAIPLLLVFIAGRRRGGVAATGMRCQHMGDSGRLGCAYLGRAGACRGVRRRTGGSLGAIADVCPLGGAGAFVC